MVQHDLRQATALRDKGPLDFHPPALGVRLYRNRSHLPAINQELSALHRGIGQSSQFDLRSRQSFHSGIEQSALAGPIGILREDIFYLDLLDPREGRHRHLEAITLRPANPGMIMKTLLGRWQPVLEHTLALLHPHGLDPLCQSLHPFSSHHQVQFLGTGVGILNQDNHLVPLQHFDILRGDRETHRSRIS